MKDLLDLLRKIQEADKLANETYLRCTEHAKQVLSEKDYEGYLILMSDWTDLLQQTAAAGKYHVFAEAMASMNRILAEKEKLEKP